MLILRTSPLQGFQNLTHLADILIKDQRKLFDTVRLSRLHEIEFETGFGFMK